MAKKIRELPEKKTETTRCPSCGDPAKFIREYAILWRDPVRRHYQFDKERRRMKAWACQHHQFCTLVTIEGKPCVPIVSQSETEPRPGHFDDTTLSPRNQKIVSKFLEPIS